jgi:GNAT superfamily N-acetyltransferase
MSLIGQEPFVAVIGRCLTGTLDRADALVLRRYRPEEWASKFLEHRAKGADQGSWLYADTADGVPIGFAGLAGRISDPRAGTLVFIGVLPEQRGRHYIDQLIYAAYRAARTRGFTGVSSLVDVANQPMMAAMRRTGADANTDPWHKWLYVR